MSNFFLHFSKISGVLNRCGPVPEEVATDKINIDLWTVKYVPIRNYHNISPLSLTESAAWTSAGGHQSLSPHRLGWCELESESECLRQVSWQADVLIVASYFQIDIRKHCIKCHPYWAGRLSAKSDER